MKTIYSVNTKTKYSKTKYSNHTKTKYWIQKSNILYCTSLSYTI